MKTPVLLLAFLWASLANAQLQIKMDNSTGKYFLKGVLQVDSLNGKLAFKRASFWVDSTFKSPQFIQKFNSGNTGKLEFKGSVTMPGGNSVTYQLLLETKSGKCSYSFSKFKYKTPQGETPLEGLPTKQKAIQEAEAQLDVLLKALKKALKKT